MMLAMQNVENNDFQIGTLSTEVTTRPLWPQSLRSTLSLVLAEAGKLHGRGTIHRKELHARYTHLGAESFARGYGKLAREAVGSNGIKKQLA